MHGKMIQIENLDIGWVFFNYERLPIFCYCCGILGHQDRECPQLKTGCFSSDEVEFQFGPWLHFITPRGGCERESGIPYSEARDKDNLRMDLQ